MERGEHVPSHNVYGTATEMETGPGLARAGFGIDVSKFVVPKTGSTSLKFSML